MHTARQRGDREHDAALPFPVIRDPSPLLVPTPAITRRSVRLARAEGCDRVWFGAAAPLGLMASELRQAGIERAVATTHGHEVWWARVPATRQMLRRIGDRTDVVTYLGEYTRSRIAAALTPAAAARMVRLTPGVDDDAVPPRRGRDRGPPPARAGRAAGRGMRVPGGRPEGAGRAGPRAAGDPP